MSTEKTGLDGWETYQLSKIVHSIEASRLNEYLALNRNDILQILDKMKYLGKKPATCTEDILSYLFPGSNVSVPSSIVRRYFGCKDVSKELLKKANIQKSQMNIEKNMYPFRDCLTWMDVDVEELSVLKETRYQEANQFYMKSLTSNDKEISKKFMSQAMESSILGTRLEKLISKESGDSGILIRYPPSKASQPLRTDLFIIPHLHTPPAPIMNRNLEVTRDKSNSMRTGTLRGSLSRPSVAECRTRSRTLLNSSEIASSTIFLKKSS